MTIGLIVFLIIAGSRIASWLPSFSVEVMHTTNILGIAQANNSQLNAMVSTARRCMVYSINFALFMQTSNNLSHKDVFVIE